MTTLSEHEVIEGQLIDAMEFTRLRYQAKKCSRDECLNSFDRFNRFVVDGILPDGFEVENAGNTVGCSASSSTSAPCVCAWCSKTRVKGGEWKEATKSEGSARPAEYTHGICPECRERVFGAQGRRIVVARLGAG